MMRGVTSAVRQSPLLQGCLFSLSSVVLAFLLTVSTVGVQRRNDPACYGQLGAGFPVAFICDDAGGSPLSSAGKIDSAALSRLAYGRKPST